MRLIKFTFEEDDLGNECGLAVEFKDDLIDIFRDGEETLARTYRNAVLMSKYGKRMTPKEVAIALRHLAMWCDKIEDEWHEESEPL